MGRVYGDFEVLKVGTGALSEKLENWVSGALGCAWRGNWEDAVLTGHLVGMQM